MRIVPTGFSGVAKAQAQQETFQAIAGPALVMDRGGASANQVANGFVLLIGHMNGRQFASAIEPGQLIGISPIGLHTIRGFLGNERWTDQVAVSAFVAQVAADNKAAR